MKITSLKKLAVRIDDMTLRERALMFGAAVLLLVAIPYSMVITPALNRQKAVLEKIVKEQSQISAMQVEMQKLANAQNDQTDASAREKLAGLEQRLADIGKTADAIKNQLVPPDRVSGVLRSVLANSSRVQLVSLRTLPGAPAFGPSAPAPTQSQPTANDAASSRLPQEHALYRHGVELAVSGSYADLVQYLTSLEKLPWRLLWERVELETQAYPRITMRVTLYTLSNEQTAATL